jgi:hypothetical protein
MTPQNIITPANAGTSYAIIAILLTVLAQIVMQILSTFKSKETTSNNGLASEQNVMLKDLHKWVGKLYEWHDVKDEDGLPVWYVNRTLRKTVEETSETMSDIKDILKDLKDTVSNNTKVIEMFVAMVSKTNNNG